MTTLRGARAVSLTRRRSRANPLARTFAQFLRHCILILRHPTEALWEIKYEGQWIAVPILVALAVAVHLIVIQFTAYEFTTVEPETTNLLLEVAKVLAPWATWVVSCYGISSIFYGEGTFKNVAVCSAYALLPYVLFNAEYSVIFSHVLSLDEKVLYYLGQSLITFWMLFLFWLHLKVVHDFPFGKSILVGALSIFGMIVIWVLLALIYLLTLQMVQFFVEIAYEFVTRGP
ncbi:MAG: YIP1 family protein [Chloroflexi bacterium]|nr:YIP1 family protein [Chloroflexota bacterium]